MAHSSSGGCFCLPLFFGARLPTQDLVGFPQSGIFTRLPDRASPLWGTGKAKNKSSLFKNRVNESILHASLLPDRWNPDSGMSCQENGWQTSTPRNHLPTESRNHKTTRSASDPMYHYLSWEKETVYNDRKTKNLTQMNNGQRTYRIYFWCII